MQKQKRTKPNPASGKKTAHRNAKRRGEIGEAAFLAKAAAMGFGVAKPWGDSDRYDFIVDVSGRLLKVQIKSAHWASVSHSGGYNIGCCGYQRNSYQPDQIDLLVAYVVPEDVWYVFPPSAFKTMKSLHLFPHEKQRVSKFNQYREAWHYFHE